MNRTYTELSRLKTFTERYHYLRLQGQVGAVTFGWERHWNQNFYRSYEWKQVRHVVIARDLGCDLGLEGYEIHERVIIHHMNPMTRRNARQIDESIVDPEFLITVTHRTHNAIHYGDEGQLPRQLIVRTPGDHIPWR